MRPRASSCAELGDSRAGWPVRKVGPGWLAARPHNAPPPAPHPPPALLLSAAAASTDYPAAPAGSLHWSPSCSSSHPPPAACAALTQLQPRQSLPSVRMETYATHVVPFCSKIRLSVNTGSHAHCTRGQLLQLIGEILLRGPRLLARLLGRASLKEDNGPPHTGHTLDHKTFLPQKVKKHQNKQPHLQVLK